LENNKFVTVHRYLENSKSPRLGQIAKIAIG
jgi:hypothetical protein